jgi:hypothetical protein
VNQPLLLLAVAAVAWPLVLIAATPNRTIERERPLQKTPTLRPCGGTP